MMLNLFQLNKENFLTQHNGEIAVYGYLLLTFSTNFNFYSRSTIDFGSGNTYAINVMSQFP